MTSVLKTALVTGAGQRLGAAMAESLGARGYAVAVHYRGSRAGAEQTAARVDAAGGRAALVRADLADESQTTGLVPQAEAALGAPIALLVNNASTFEDDDVQTHTRADWDKHMEANLRAPIVLAQAFAKALPAEAQGLILNMLDQRVKKLNPTFFTYTLSKMALWTATQTLAQALGPNIRVNAIGPGPTLQNARQESDDFRAQYAATPLERPVSVEDIVRALLYFLDADAVTGQMLAVDSGQHLIWRTPDVDGVVE